MCCALIITADMSALLFRMHVRRIRRKALIIHRGGSSFSVRGGGGGVKFDKKIFYCKGVDFSKGFLMQSKAYWALFLTQYISPGVLF